jgi:iron complex outermembrane receptor protein
MSVRKDKPNRRGLRAGAALALLFASASSAALAQAASAPRPQAAKARPRPPEPPDDATVSELVVTADRDRPQPGAVVGDIKPDLQLGPQEIQAYGVSTLTQLLDELAPQIRSDRGRGGEAPVILLNGRRISGFNEIRDLPTEAIQRVDLLPEEAALKYGYSANQRVVNIVLRRFFRAVTAEANGGAATEGGLASGQAELDLLRIRRDSRFNVDLKVSGQTALTEDERDLVSRGPSADPRATVLSDVTNLGHYRTLAPASRNAALNVVYAAPIFAGLQATLNGTLEARRTEALQGLPVVALAVPAGDPFAAGGASVDRSVAAFGPLRLTTDTWTGHLGSGLNRDIAKWRLSLTGAYDHADLLTHSDTGLDATALQARLNGLDPTFDPFSPLPRDQLTLRAQDEARALSDGLNAHVLANGPLLTLPAGPLFASLKVGDTQSWFSSSAVRFGVTKSVDLSRNDLSAQANLDLPIASRKTGVLAAVGDLSLNGNAALDHLSDFGDLTSLGYGLNWRPITPLSLIVSHTREAAAPSMNQLGDPAVVTPGARLFDFVTGRTVDVRRLDGGNRALTGDLRNVLKVGINLKPFSSEDLTLSANYVHSRTDNPIRTFPAVTPEIEAAFPDRFVRDAAGQLVQVDLRPVNFASETVSDLRWGINYTKRLGPQPPQVQRFRGPDGGPRGGGGGDGPPRDGGPRGFGGGFGAFGPGRTPPTVVQFALYHTVYFEDQYLVRAGGPKLDLLNGAAGSSSGGQPRHEIELQAGLLKNGFGARLSGDWKSGTTVHDAASVGDLTFSAIAKLDLRLFADLSQRRELVARLPFFRGSRLTLAVTNLFDQRVQVHDATGATPVSYQSAYLDPVGRKVSIGFRKLFIPPLPAVPPPGPRPAG